jgi:hypothetical protein
MAGDVVDPEAFREWAAPHVTAIRALTAAIDEVPERHGGLPDATSGAIGELSDEQRYRSRSAWNQPVTDTHLFGGLTLRAANDYVRGLAELFGSGHPPLYAHLSLARAGFEAAGVSAWLSEPGIGTEERIKRGLCELIYSAREVEELNLGTAGAERVEFWTTVATAFGWVVTGRRGKPTIEGARRPRVSDGIVDLLGGTADDRIGDLLYSRLSAVDHVTWFGITSAFDLRAAERNEHAGTATVPLTVDGAWFSAYTYYVIRVIRAAAHTRFTLMGWLDEAWRSASAEADELEGRLLRILAERPPAALDAPMPPTAT